MRRHPLKDDEFAQTRSNDTSKFAYDVCRTIAQTCLLINGGAATAVVALLGKDKVDQALLTFVPLGLGGYAFGVAVSAFMLYCVMMMADNWNFYWQTLSYGHDKKGAVEYENKADFWQSLMNGAFGTAIVCFAVASVLVAVGMWKSIPTVPAPPTAVTITPAPK